MAIKKQQTNFNNKPKATGWLRPRLIVRDSNGNITDQLWLCADVPLFSNEDETNTAGSLVANSRENPEYTYELVATVNAVKDPAEMVQLSFAAQ